MLDNVNIDRSQKTDSDRSAALTVKGDGDTEIELDGDNILKGSYSYAALEKPTTMERALLRSRTITRKQEV